MTYKKTQLKILTFECKRSRMSKRNWDILKYTSVNTRKVCLIEYVARHQHEDRWEIYSNSLPSLPTSNPSDFSHSHLLLSLLLWPKATYSLWFTMIFIFIFHHSSHNIRSCNGCQKFKKQTDGMNIFRWRHSQNNIQYYFVSAKYSTI